MQCNVFLAIAANIPQRLKTGFVVTYDFDHERAQTHTYPHYLVNCSFQALNSLIQEMLFMHEFAHVQKLSITWTACTDISSGHD